MIIGFIHFSLRKVDQLSIFFKTTSVNQLKYPDQGIGNKKLMKYFEGVK